MGGGADIKNHITTIVGGTGTDVKNSLTNTIQTTVNNGIQNVISTDQKLLGLITRNATAYAQPGFDYGAMTMWNVAVGQTTGDSKYVLDVQTTNGGLFYLTYIDCHIKLDSDDPWYNGTSYAGAPYSFSNVINVYADGALALQIEPPLQHHTYNNRKDHWSTLRLDANMLYTTGGLYRMNNGGLKTNQLGEIVLNAPIVARNTLKIQVQRKVTNNSGPTGTSYENGIRSLIPAIYGSVGYIYSI